MRKLLFMNLVLFTGLIGLFVGCVPIPMVVIEDKEKPPELEFIPLSGQQLLMSTRMVSQDTHDNRIVCAVKLTETHYDIFTLNKDGSDLKRLTFDGMGENYLFGSPKWVFNGSKIFYTYEGKFFIMNPDGTDLRGFDCNGTSNVTITPQKDKIIFPKEEAIYVMDSRMLPEKLYEIPEGYKGFGILEVNLVNDKILFCISKFSGMFSAKYKYFSLDLSGNIKELDENYYKSIVKNSRANPK